MKTLIFYSPMIPFIGLLITASTLCSFTIYEKTMFREDIGMRATTALIGIHTISLYMLFQWLLKVI